MGTKNLEVKIVLNADGTSSYKVVGETSGELKKLGTQADDTNKRTTSLKNTLIGLASTGAVAAFVQTSVGQFREFNVAMTEVSTLLDDVPGQMDILSDAANDQAAAFASFPADQARAQYQIISAGAEDAADAIDTLTASNKLAIGGVTDIATAADGLTSVMNSYGDAAGTATDVSDSMFVAMRAGKTTIGELSAGIGKVAPLASTMGVSFDELTASIAALTKGGISTQESITGVRAVLAAVAKPTKEASDMAASLGLEFNTAALQSQGFAGFMAEVQEKTGGSTDALAKLFGGVEALVPAMALTGKAGEDLNVILEDMENKAGETEKAFVKISESADFQFRELQSNISVSMTEAGESITDGLLPIVSLLNDNFDEAEVVVKVFATAVTATLIPSLVKLGVQMALLTGPAGLLAGVAAGIAAIVIQSANFRDRMLEIREEVVDSFAAIGAESDKVEQVRENLMILGEQLGNVQERMAEVAETSGESSQEYKDLEKTADQLQKGIKDLASQIGDQTKKTKTLTGEVETNTGATGKNSDAVKKQAGEYQKLRDRLDPVGALQRQFVVDLQTLESRFRLANTPIEEQQFLMTQLADEYTDAVDKALGVTDAQKEMAEAAEEENERLGDLIQSVNELTDDLIPAEAAQRELEDATWLLEEAFQENIISLEKKNELLEELRDRTEESGDETVTFADSWEAAMERVDEAFADAWAGAFDSFDDFADKLLDAFKSMLGEMAHQAITKPIFDGFVSQFDGLIQTVSAKVGEMTKNVTDSMASASGWDWAAAAAGATYIGGGYNYVKDEYGSSAATGFALMPQMPVIGATLGRLFGGYEYRDAAMFVDYAGGDVSGQTRTDYIKDRPGSDNAWRQVWADIDSELQVYLQTRLDTVKNIVTTVGEGFGKSGAEILSALNGVVTSLDIGNLKGKSEEEINAALQQWVDDTALELMQAVVPEFTRVIQMAGDRASELVQPLLDIASYLADDWGPAVQGTLLEQANASYSTVREQLSLYNGTVESTQLLAYAATDRLNLEVALLQQIEAVSLSITDATGSIKDRIDRALRSDAEQIEWLTNQQNALREQLINAADPEEIQRLVQEITRLSGEQIGLLSEEQLGAVADEIKMFMDDVDGIAQAKLSEIEAATQLQHEIISDGIMSALSAGTERFIESAEEITVASVGATVGAALLVEEAAQVVASVDAHVGTLGLAANDMTSAVTQANEQSLQASVGLTSAASLHDQAARNLNTAAVSLNNSAAAMIQAAQALSTGASTAYYGTWEGAAAA